MSTELTAWQKTTHAEFKRVQEENPRSFRLVGRRKLDSNGKLPLEIELPTSDLPHVEGGAVFRAKERFLVLVPQYETNPFQIVTEHHRFIDVPHVLQGDRLCIYLDPSREWDPSGGVPAFLERLWAWLADASTDSFDPTTALYHAVGGVLHASDDSPTYVVREELPSMPSLLYAITRNANRIDISSTRAPDSHAVAMGHSDRALPLGAGRTLAELTLVLNSPKLDLTFAGQSTARYTVNVGDRLLTAAKRNPAGSPLSLMLTVAHPSGGSPHVLVGQISPGQSDALRAVPAVGDNLPNVDITWCPVSDERPSVTTRRDSGRPVAAFNEKSLTLFGCGGLGSWIAEFAVRAGIRRIRLVDPGRIIGGLLVRQNFTEGDVGRMKVDALASRLRLISDDLKIIDDNDLIASLVTGVQQDDLIIDTTVTRSIGRYLNQIVEAGARHATIAQMATDSGSGTLGLLTVIAPSDPRTPELVDTHAQTEVEATPSLEPYATFWSRFAAGQVVPTRGCSIPTFHGSAADLAAIAGSLLSLLGTQLREPHSGVHLLALPHAAGDIPRHLFIAAP